MDVYRVQYSNDKHSKFLRGYMTESKYDAMTWYECHKFWYNFVYLFKNDKLIKQFERYDEEEEEKRWIE